MPHDFNEVVVKTGPHGGASADPNAHPLAPPPPGLRHAANTANADSAPQTRAGENNNRGYL